MKVIPKTLVDRADLKHINDLNLWWFAFLEDDWQTLNVGGKTRYFWWLIAVLAAVMP